MVRYGYGGGWAPYVSVAQRRSNAARLVARLREKGKSVRPVEIEGRAIAKTFWGRAWCTNLERYSDEANRLPRGRRYARNGSVVDLQIEAGLVQALVSGSEIYRVRVQVKQTPRARWLEVVRRCAGKIDSVVELLSGRLSKGVMEVLSSQKGGLYPGRKEITTSCDCPDYARMCKHIAAVLYGIGARLDDEPELLFVLRDVDPFDLIAEAELSRALGGQADTSTGEILEGGGLAELFGIELDLEAGEAAAPAKRAPKRRSAGRKSAPRKRAAKGRSAGAKAAGLATLLDALTRATLLRSCDAFALSLDPGYVKRAALVQRLQKSRGVTIARVAEGLGRKELERACTKLGLPCSGKRKADLVARILGALAG
ncbi:MAG: SWIM zinc finger family protein [Planctomycetes bacterium]|nr:SWIM zinc finger family protein [Planctomycetota bacterium]